MQNIDYNFNQQKLERENEIISSSFDILLGCLFITQTGKSYSQDLEN